MRKWLRLREWVMPVVAVLSLPVVAFFLVKYESEYLWKVQELNLFLDTPLFLKQQMVSSGWLLTWLGTWFTEFFFHPWLGVTLLCSWWAVLMFVLSRAFRVPPRWALLLLVPVAMLLLSDVSLGYWIYYLKLRGHFFAATIGTTIAVAAVWLYRMIAAEPSASGSKDAAAPALTSHPSPLTSHLSPLTSKISPPLVIVLCTALLYPLIGFYALLAALLMGVLSWRLHRKRVSCIIDTFAALASIGILPLLYYRFVFYETNIVNIYYTGLPLFRYGEEYVAYYIPYYILVAWLVLLALLSFKPIGRQESHQSNSKTSPLTSHLSLLTPDVISIFLLAGIVYGVWHFWYKDYNFHKELRMQQCLERADWNGIIAEAADQQDEPTRAIVMMRNLALFRLGRQGDEMYHYRPGAKASDTPLVLRMTQVAGRSIYYNYGQVNYCYRWCLEDGVEMGWRVEYLKYLTRCSLINGEYRVARKYINELKHTRYYRDWALEHERFLDNDEAMHADPNFEPIFHLLCPDDQLASDNSMVEYFLMNNFANSFSEDPLYQEQVLLAALWTKDIQTFWPRFFNYATSHSKPQDSNANAIPHMPTHFQEAAYLYGHLEHEVDISGMPFDEKVKNDYEEFMAMAQRYQGMSEEQLRPIMYPRFGKTFYYEYFLVRNQKLY